VPYLLWHLISRLKVLILHFIWFTPCYFYICHRCFSFRSKLPVHVAWNTTLVYPFNYTLFGHTLDIWILSDKPWVRQTRSMTLRKNFVRATAPSLPLQTRSCSLIEKRALARQDLSPSR